MATATEENVVNARGVIIAAAFGYPLEKITPFLKSASLCGLSTPIVLIRDTKCKDFERRARDIYSHTIVWAPTGAGVHRVCRRLLTRVPIRFFAGWAFGKAWRRSNRAPQSLFVRCAPALLHVSLARYLYAYHYLSRHHGDYPVLLADIRDVIFQADPFRSMPDAVVTGMEAAVIKDRVWNSLWIYRLYGDQGTLEKLRDRRIICSGVTLGPRHHMLQYLEAMVEEILDRIEVVCGFGSFDQGVHNKIMWGDTAFPKEFSRNGIGRIATLGSSIDFEDVTEDEELGLVGQDRNPVPIVHQYDRHPHLVTYFRRRLELSDGLTTEPMESALVDA